MNTANLPPGTVLGKYAIVRLIGSGGMGAVYEGTHLELRKRVAVKTLLPALAANPEARARFLREGEAASRIDHPHVVNVTDVGTGGDTPFLVMEYLEGENLAQRLAREGRLPIDTTVELLLPILDALASGHDEGVIHRDLKPHNIFLARARDGRIVPKLLDFGVSKIIDEQGSSALTGSMHMLGTAQYMAPEQVDGARHVDGRTDQYAMGLVLFECAAGLPARQGETPLGMLKGVAMGQLPSLRSWVPDVDPVFEAVVLRTLSPQPHGRFPATRDLMRALLPFARPHTRAHWAELLAATSSPGGATPPPMAKTIVLSDSAQARLAPPAPVPEPRAAPSTFRNVTGEIDETFRTRPRSRWPLAIGLLVVVGLAAAGALVFLPGDGSSRRRAADRGPIAVPVLDPAPAPTPVPAPAPRAIELRATPAEATITVDDVRLGRSPVRYQPTPGAHHLVVAAPGHQTVTMEFSEEAPPPALVELKRLEPSGRDRPRAKDRPRPSSTRSQPSAGEAPQRRGPNNSLIIE